MGAALWATAALAAMDGPLAFAAGVPLVVSAMMYCRLLGRVTWHGSGAAAVSL